MRFRFVEENRTSLSAERLCQIMNVSSRGYRAYRARPISQSQRKDMVLLAHIREQHRLSLNSYGRPRMTEELKELGLNVGHRRVGRLIACNHREGRVGRFLLGDVNITCQAMDAPKRNIRHQNSQIQGHDR